MADDASTPEREETEQERLNRELDQLLGELRVAMPGVQVLFAFLLTVPFQQRFAQVTEFQRDVYFVTLLAAAAASALFVAPTAYHRLMFRERDKPRLVAISTKLALAGLACLAVAMNGAVLLVTDVLFEPDDRRRDRRRHRDAVRRPVVRARPRTRDSARTAATRHERTGRDPRRRRDARRLQLPARAGLVPRVSPARHHDPRLALPPRDRDGRRPARALPRRRGLRRRARRRGPRRRARAVRADDLRGAAVRGRARADRGPQVARLQGRAGVVGEVRGHRALHRPARRPRARRRLDGLEHGAAHEARARPRQGGARPRRRRPRRHGRRLDVGRRGRQEAQGPDGLRADGRVRRRRAARGRRDRRVRLDRRAARGVVENAVRVAPQHDPDTRPLSASS